MAYCGEGRHRWEFTRGMMEVDGIAAADNPCTVCGVSLAEAKARAAAAAVQGASARLAVQELVASSRHAVAEPQGIPWRVVTSPGRERRERPRTAADLVAEIAAVPRDGDELLLEAVRDRRRELRSSAGGAGSPYRGSDAGGSPSFTASFDQDGIYTSHVDRDDFFSGEDSGVADVRVLRKARYPSLSQVVGRAEALLTSAESLEEVQPFLDAWAQVCLAVGLGPSPTRSTTAAAAGHGRASANHRTPPMYESSWWPAGSDPVDDNPSVVDFKPKPEPEPRPEPRPEPEPVVAPLRLRLGEAEAERLGDSEPPGAPAVSHLLERFDSSPV